MTEYCFTTQIARLRAVFGEKPFHQHRLEIIHRATKALPDQAFEQICSLFLTEMKYAPMPKDFIEASREFKRGSRPYALGELQPREIALCWDCADSGFVRIKRLENYEPWAKWEVGSAPCQCLRGKFAIEAARRHKSPVDLGPQFNIAWRKSYEIMATHGPNAPKINFERQNDR